MTQKARKTGASKPREKVHKCEIPECPNIATVLTKVGLRCGMHDPILAQLRGYATATNPPSEARG